MRLDERKPTSLSLSWVVTPRHRAPPRSFRYELTYRKKVQQPRTPPWSSLHGTTPSCR